MSLALTFGLGASPILPPPLPSADTFKTALVAALKAETNLAAIVGAKVFPLSLPQSTVLPALAWRVSDVAREHNLSGAIGVATAAVKLGVYSRDATDCLNASEVLRNRFDGMIGPLSTGVTILFAELEDCDDEYDPTDDGGGSLGTYRTILTFRFKYRESLPTLT